MKAAIIGNSGSGKSTLALSLAAASGAEVLDLDTVAWDPNRIAVPRATDLAIRDVRRFCRSRDAWIVEGCYGNLIGAALDFEPLLVFLDPGLEQCVANCRARPWEPHKYASKEEQDARLERLLEWVAAYYERDGDQSYTAHHVLFAGYVGPKRRLTGPVAAGIAVRDLLDLGNAR